jgi:flagellar motility protein MotE (MotC chaperone)
MASLLFVKVVDVTLPWLPDASRRPVEAVREQLFAEVAQAATPADPKAEAAKPESGSADPSTKSEAGKFNTASNDAGKTDAGKTDAGKTDAGKTDAGKNDAGKNEARKGDVVQPQQAVAPGATEGSAATPIGEVAAQLGPGVSESERALLVDLRSRRQELDRREAELAQRANVMAAAEGRLASRLDELKALQVRLEAMEKARQAETDANIRGLVKVYEDMRPRDAAAIWNDLDMDVLLPLLDRMKEAKAASLLAAMDPLRAREATARLAKRRAQATLLNAAPAATLTTSPGTTGGPTGNSSGQNAPARPVQAGG